MAHAFKRTKIVCTIGPASAIPSMLVRMMQSGMDMARLNFSHGTHEEHARLLRAIRGAARKVGKTVAVLQDLQGPKIRVGDLPDGGVTLKKGEIVALTTASADYAAGGPIPVTYRSLHRDVRKDHRILFDDGTIEAVVMKVRGKVITVKMTVPGLLKSHKGMNLPDSSVGAEPFTAKDREDLLFGVAQGVDWVALSFVSCAADIQVARTVARNAARAHGGTVPLFFAKVERRAAVDNFQEILEAADGILLGRGDLGVEIRPEEVPVVQKDVVEACRKAGKPVIVATQMLNSMVDNPRSTRAETSDVANAVFDHADAVMLSAESATGRYPAITVQAMAAVIREAEQSRYDDIHHLALHVAGLPEGLAQAVHVLGASGVIGAAVTVAGQGDVARKINLYRPNIPLIMLCEDDVAARRLAPVSGVLPIVMNVAPGSLTSRLRTAIRRARFMARGTPFALITATGADVSLSIIRS